MKFSNTLFFCALLNFLAFSQQGDYTASWGYGTNIPAPTRFHGSGCLWSNRTQDTVKLICFGGDVDGNGTVSNLTSIYNLTNNSWSTGTNLSFGRFYGFACCIGDSAYYFGGVGGPSGWTNEVNTVDIYSIRTNTMSSGTLLPITMADARALPYQDSLIYIIGGMTGGTQNATANVYLFNRMQLASYRPATSLPAPRCGFASVIVGDTIYVVCGGTGYNTGLTNTLYVGVISQSNRANITWSTGTNYPGTSRWRFYAEKWGCIGFITGCGSAVSYQISPECYIYNTGNHTWQAQVNAPVQTAAYFSGSVSFANSGITKWIVASGFSPIPPYSTSYVQIFTDSLCPSYGGNYPCEGFNNYFFPPTGWSISGTGAAYWSLQPQSGYNLGFGSARFNCWNAPNGYTGNLTTYNFYPVNFYDSLMFDYAYCPYFTSNDQLLVQASSNFGTTWNTILTMNYTDLITTTNCNNSEFIPASSSDWKTKKVLIPYGTNKFNFQCISGFGNDIWIDSICIPFFVGISHNQNKIPNTFSLSQNYPNPFNPVTTINYELPPAKDGMFQITNYVKLAVYDVLGKEAAVLVNEKQTAGKYRVTWDGSAYSSGIYFYKLVVDGNIIDTKKMVLIK